jgi:hypothetical protein
MKKSEAIRSIKFFLYENTGQFNPGHVGMELSICEKLAPLLLEHILEEMDMKPYLYTSMSGDHVLEWEDE